MDWISVKDRLPNKLQKVLFHWVLTDSFGVPCVRNVSMGYMCEAGWDIYLPYHSFGLRADVCPVTHWMELPDFPEPIFKKMEVGEIIIDDTLAQIPDKLYEKILPKLRESEESVVVFASLENSKICTMDEQINEKQIPEA